MERITEVTVKLEDGTSKTWQGVGTCSLTNTKHFKDKSDMKGTTVRFVSLHLQLPDAPPETPDQSDETAVSTEGQWRE